MEVLCMITICTPTYNRAYILGQLYKSLQNQTCKKFVWCIVDDGSTDNTKKLVDQWLKENNQFKINYYYQQNSGEMRALNSGAKHTDTELFFFVDSDDWLVPDAIEKISSQWEIEKNSNTKYEVCGIMAYHGDAPNHYYNGKELPVSGDYTTLSYTAEKGFHNTLALVLRTDIVKQHPFPEIKGEKFISEEYVYLQIDQKYHYKILREVVQIKNFHDDGLSKDIGRVYYQNPKGSILLYNQGMKLHKTFKQRIKDAANYVCYSFVEHNSHIVQGATCKGLTIMMYPIGIYLFWKRSRRYRINRN